MDLIAEEIGQNEAYILATLKCDPDGRLYHLIVDSAFMFSTDDLKGALIDIICYYYVLDISLLSQSNACTFNFYAAFYIWYYRF